MKRFLLPLAFLLVLIPLWGQYNERDILNQQAYQMLGQRQFAEAEKIFLQVLEKYPDDANSVLQLLNIYFQTSQLDKAENLLRQYRRILPANQATEQEILLLVMQGRPDDAWNLGQTQLSRMNHSESTYRLLASYFERRGFYDHVLRLYEEARARRGNPDLFRLEIANAALNYRRFEQALREYLSFLEKNPSNIYFVNNQCKTILRENPELIATIGEFAETSANPIIKELYANALLSQNRAPEALEVYKNLPPERLLSFAEQQYAALNDEVALPAFEHLAGISTETLERNDYRLRQAFIHFRSGRHVETDSLLRAVIADSLMLERKNYQRRGVNLNARKLMAENSLALTKSTATAKTWYEEARRFCGSAYDRQNIDLALVRLLAIDQDFETALAILNGVNEPKHLETRDYLRFSVELLRGNTDVADSLMNEYVIRWPGGVYVNDAIYQMMFVLELSGKDLDSFHLANRMMLLGDPAAVDTLAAVFASTDDEELLILAVEWAILLAEPDKALNLLEHDWQDPVSAEYAALLRLKLSTAEDEAQRFARDFLTANPGSIFAPKFRMSLARTGYSRPDF
ncbi:MAG TPA: tetratricopeptide repeat protein [Candidatus Syntrophosphaera sp.]|jgi:tetratricopeptide (TPR) repeat protein|nr:tetratricopeptide repeat protein [Candidatus Syntrophosphaera sp.]HOH48146.1 tetratricopeptide repeat protein [Candidatus Syntrophosphaera sp.]HPW37932.1 tetratricopeptide repeat protein [Candidatus Syntrophosphaera sp.]